MSTNNVFYSRGSLQVILAVLFAVSGLASCGSGGGSTTTVSPSPNTSPTVSLSAASSIIGINASTTVSWSSTNTTSCTSSGGGGTGTTGSFNTGPLSTTTTYTVTCTGPSGSASQSITITVASSSSAALITQAAIASVQAGWAATPLPSTGTIHYFCNCGTGAAGNCVNGNDANNGLSMSTPKQTITALQTLFSSPIPSGDTVALCKGGAWTATTPLSVVHATCAAGTTCNDLRDYASSVFTSSQKPIITANAAIGGGPLFNFNTNPSRGGGIRIFNLDIENPDYSVNYGFRMIAYQHDITIANNTINGFQDAFNVDSGSGHNNNINVVGNTITNSANISYLGDADNSTLNYNYWTGNGGGSAFLHTIYITSGANLGSIMNMTVQGNYIESGPTGGGTCVGTIFDSHGGLDYYTVKDNYVTSLNTSAACYGLAFTNTTTNTNPVYFRHTVISGNTVVNTGQQGIMVTSCGNTAANPADIPSYCYIENNVVVFTWPTTIQLIGIVVPDSNARAQDDIGTHYTVRNNTIYYGPNSASTNGAEGIKLTTTGAAQGSGFVISNNAVYYSATSGKVFCFYPVLPTSTYAFFDNNDCYSAPAQFNWTQLNGNTLAGWQTATGFDTHSITANPQFTKAPTFNFIPQPGSPLLGAGNHTNSPLVDALGVTRPNPPAIGAYE